MTHGEESGRFSWLVRQLPKAPPDLTVEVQLVRQLGNTSRRLDAMLTGHSPTSAENEVVVEPSGAE